MSNLSGNREVPIFFTASTTSTTAHSAPRPSTPQTRDHAAQGAPHDVQRDPDTASLSPHSIIAVRVHRGLYLGYPTGPFRWIEFVGARKPCHRPDRETRWRDLERAGVPVDRAEKRQPRRWGLGGQLERIAVARCRASTGPTGTFV